jgi:hypothetical protein
MRDRLPETSNAARVLACPISQIGNIQITSVTRAAFEVSGKREPIRASDVVCSPLPIGPFPTAGQAARENAE